MEQGTQKENEIIQQFFNLYITAQYKYLIMDKDGNYRTYNAHENKNHKTMSKWHIREHLKGKHTLGIFAANFVTNFICFDIDVHDKLNAKWTTYKLIDILINLGVPEEYIYISTSGNKGYHVDIYFKEAIFNGAVKDFYEIVMSNIDMENVKGEIELRPTKQGLKLPLGVNFKNKNKLTNKCWYVDYDKGLEPIKDVEYILKIKQIDIEIIKNIIEEQKEIDIFDYKVDKIEAVEVETTKGYLDSKYQSLDGYKQNIDNDKTIEVAQKLEIEGLKIAGTRHNSLYNLCKYYKYLGMTQEENDQELIDWMNSQDPSTYTTKLNDCHKDIKEITKYIYDNDINLTRKETDIRITYDEMLYILEIETKNEKLLVYSMMIHSKRYANEKGIFYMTYKQMAESTGLGERTVKRLINKINESNHIEIVERNRKVLDSKGKLITKRPNKYKINYISKEENNNQFIIISNNNNLSLNEALLSLFDITELKKILPIRHYQEIRKANA